MKSESHFSLVFRGPAVDNGEIDVQYLAPALLATSDLMQAVNQLINGDVSKVAVKIRASSEGSFEVDLALWQQFMETIFTYSKDHKDGIAAANELADLVLKAGTATVGLGGGLFALLKWARGRKPDRITEHDEGVRIHIGDIYFLTNKNTVELAENHDVRKQTKKLVSVLKKDGINSLTLKSDRDDEIIIALEDVNSFDHIEEDEEIEERARNAILRIISLSFKEKNKWILTDGGEPFTATIEDEEFLKKIENGEISFAKNDYLVCKLIERQIFKSNRLKNEIAITDVMEHKTSPKQLRFI